MDEEERFRQEVETGIARMAADADVAALSRIWVREMMRHQYSHHFRWLGVPIIQLPQDVMAMQELVWATRPDVIVETGVARGGSLIFYASMMQLLGGDGKVVGVDIDIRPHARKAIAEHPFASRISLVEGSSIEPTTFERVLGELGGRRRVLVVLDSNHTHEHVLTELRMYGRLVQSGSWLVVMDTLIEDVPAEYSSHRSWAPGNSPKSAVRAFLTENFRFVADTSIDAKLSITASPEGFLRCVADGERP
jgi:cephalosporin hydroxylase